MAMMAAAACIASLSVDSVMLDAAVPAQGSLARVRLGSTGPVIWIQFLGRGTNKEPEKGGFYKSIPISKHQTIEIVHIYYFKSQYNTKLSISKSFLSEVNRQEKKRAPHSALVLLWKTSEDVSTILYIYNINHRSTSILYKAYMQFIKNI